MLWVDLKGRACDLMRGCEELKMVLLNDLEAMGRGRRGGVGWRTLLGFYLIRLAFRVVVNYRLGSWFRRLGHRLVGAWFDRRDWRTGVDICSQANIGHGLRIAHPIGILIGGGVVIGESAQIQQNASLGAILGEQDLATPGGPLPGTATMSSLARVPWWLDRFRLATVCG